MEDLSNLLFSSLFLLHLISFLILLLMFLFCAIRKNTRSKPGADCNFHDLVRNSHRFLDWTTELLAASPTCTVRFPGNGMILTASASSLEHIIKTNFHNYQKGPRQIGVLEDLLGRGIFNSDGEHWQLQREIASLEFNTKTFRAFVFNTICSEVVDRLLPFLSSSAAAAATNGESATLDLQDTLARFTFDNVCKIMFNVDAGRLAREDNKEGDALACSYEEAVSIVTGRFRMPGLLWKLTRLLNLGTEKRLKRELAVVNDFITKVITKRKKTRDGNCGDLLSRFIKGCEEEEEEEDFSDEFVRDVMSNFLFAGRDTTSSAMAWFFWLVSSKPEVEQKILEETRSVRAKHGSLIGNMFTLEELREMNYLHAALSETMRLYPPIAMNLRTCTEEDVLPDGTKVEKGVSVMHSLYAMGRMESIWGEDCREFRPERWLDSNGVFQPKNPYRYPAFYAGTRTCLGKEMAHVQMKAVAASVMEKFLIDVVEEGEREKELAVVLRMKKGLPVRIRAR